jgi:hypothetical protein
MRSEKGVSRIIFKIIHHLCNSIDPASISDFVKYDSKRSYLRVSIMMVCFFAWIVCNSFIFSVYTAGIGRSISRSKKVYSLTIYRPEYRTSTAATNSLQNTVQNRLRTSTVTRIAILRFTWIAQSRTITSSVSWCGIRTRSGSGL